MTLIIGIDPGLKGAIFRCYPENAMSDGMPVAETKRNGKVKNELDLARLADLLYNPAMDAHAFVERVGAMPGQGVSSMFSFGKSYGAILGILAAFQIPVTFVEPRVWKSKLKVRGGKVGALLHASELMPRWSHLWTPKRGEMNKEQAIGRADAALIAYYGQHHG